MLYNFQRLPNLHRFTLTNGDHKKKDMYILRFGAQSSYVVKYFEGSNAGKMMKMCNQTTPKIIWLFVFSFKTRYDPSSHPLCDVRMNAKYSDSCASFLLAKIYKSTLLRSLFSSFRSSKSSLRCVGITISKKASSCCILN